MFYAMFTDTELDDIYDYCHEKDIKIETFIHDTLLDNIYD